jgi:hypothetical protein
MHPVSKAIRIVSEGDSRNRCLLHNANFAPRNSFDQNSIQPEQDLDTTVWFPSPLENLEKVSHHGVLLMRNQEVTGY